MKQCESLPLYPPYDKVSFFSRHHLNKRLLLEKQHLNKTKHFLEAYSLCNPNNNNNISNIFKKTNTSSLHKKQSSSLDAIITNQNKNNKTIHCSSQKMLQIKKKKKDFLFLKTQFNNDNANTINGNSEDGKQTNKFGRSNNNDMITKIKNKMFFMKDTINFIYPRVHDIRQRERIRDKKRWNKNKVNSISCDEKNREVYTCQTSPKILETKKNMNMKLVRRRLPKIKGIPIHK